MTRLSWRLAGASAILMMMASCSEGPAREDLLDDVETAPLINGTPTNAVPAVGVLLRNNNDHCTATLISSRVIVTAAHCFAFDTTMSGYGAPPSFYNIRSNFSFKPSNVGTQTPVAVLRFVVLGTAYGDQDVAVGELESDVPASVATPLRVAADYPADGDWVTVWGAGAISGTTTTDDAGNGIWNPDVVNPPGGFTVQAQADTWNAALKTANHPHACPGDSGGPLLNTNLEVVMVASYAGCTSPGMPLDVRADVVALSAQVSSAAAFYGVAHLCDGCSRVALRAANGLLLQATNGGGSSLTAAGPAVGTWETFRWVPLSFTHFALQAPNGFFVSAVQGGGGLLTVDKTQIGVWETFSLADYNKVTLQTMGTGNYVTVAPNSTSVRADATSPGANEIFVVEQVP